MIFTSGSTGKPKRCQVPHVGVNLRWLLPCVSPGYVICGVCELCIRCVWNFLTLEAWGGGASCFRLSSLYHVTKVTHDASRLW